MRHGHDCGRSRVRADGHHHRLGPGGGHRAAAGGRAGEHRRGRRRQRHQRQRPLRAARHSRRQPRSGGPLHRIRDRDPGRHRGRGRNPERGRPDGVGGDRPGRGDRHRHRSRHRTAATGPDRRDAGGGNDQFRARVQYYGGPLRARRRDGARDRPQRGDLEPDPSARGCQPDAAERSAHLRRRGSHRLQLQQGGWRPPGHLARPAEPQRHRAHRDHQGRGRRDPVRHRGLERGDPDHHQARERRRSGVDLRDRLRRHEDTGSAPEGRLGLQLRHQAAADPRQARPRLPRRLGLGHGFQRGRPRRDLDRTVLCLRPSPRRGRADGPRVPRLPGNPGRQPARQPHGAGNREARHSRGHEHGLQRPAPARAERAQLGQRIPVGLLPGDAQESGAALPPTAGATGSTPTRSRGRLRTDTADRSPRASTSSRSTATPSRA